MADRRDKAGDKRRLALGARERPAGVAPRPKVLRPAGGEAGVPLAVLHTLGDWVRDLVRAELERPDQDEWVDQSRSPLGRRRHLALVRQGKLPGHKDGKRVLVRRRDLDAYIEAQQAATRRRVPVDERDDIDDELTRLGFIDPPVGPKDGP